MLHIKAKDRVLVPPREEEQQKDENPTVISGFVDVESKPADNEARDTNSILAIVPVQVKAGKGSKVVNSYAFLDPGSNASFCTDKLMTELSLRGRTVNIILTTMGEQRVVRSTVVTDLEVSGLNSNDFIKLTEVFSKKSDSSEKRSHPTAGRGRPVVTSKECTSSMH